MVLTRRPRPQCIAQHPEAEDEAIPTAAMALLQTLRSRHVGVEWTLTMCTSNASSSCLSGLPSCLISIKCAVLRCQSSASMRLDSFVSRLILDESVFGIYLTLTRSERAKLVPQFEFDLRSAFVDSSTIRPYDKVSVLAFHWERRYWSRSSGFALCIYLFVFC